ncbi:nudix hydrolase 15, mitochondrial-like [Arachis stenosperma]|uniref:nudix hydrolase 15, mitochondrial-like n=1 Tax=Arachis stenosperma TaxID=217475 RepID=UPI0025ABCD80|nr:nudix hydrolase 15, mitochondrial-like [Arachis stenosperma]
MGQLGMQVPLAQQLRFYKPPSFAEEVEEQSNKEECGSGKVVSQVGFPELATPVAQNPEKFRPKRAVVLICLFEGDVDDLRVIFTKRSFKFSSHSNRSCIFWEYLEEEDKDDGDIAKEEIGLDPEFVNVSTVLEPFLSNVCYFI